MTNMNLAAGLIFSSILLMGCTTHITKSENFSGFLGDYSNLNETKTATGKPVLVWVDPSLKTSKYSYIKYEPITFYPEPKPTQQINKDTLRDVLDYANIRLKEAMGERLQLTDHAGPRTLIFRGAITGVNTSAEGLNYYEVIPITLMIAGVQTATGYRTRDTEVYFEGELIDVDTGKQVFKVVRKDLGKQVSNNDQIVTANDLKVVVDSMVSDTKQFVLNK